MPAHLHLTNPVITVAREPNDETNGILLSFPLHRANIQCRQVFEVIRGNICVYYLYQRIVIHIVNVSGSCDRIALLYMAYEPVQIGAEASVTQKAW